MLCFLGECHGLWIVSWIFELGMAGSSKLPQLNQLTSRAQLSFHRADALVAPLALLQQLPVEPKAPALGAIGLRQDAEALLTTEAAGEAAGRMRFLKGVA